MDIALCYESVLPARGGAETYIGDLARRLARDGHAVHLYASRWDASSLPASTHFHRIDPVSGPRFLRPWRFAAATERALSHASHDVTMGFDKTWGQDVLYPQGGLHAASAAHNKRKFPTAFSRALATAGKWLDPASWSYARLERKQYLGAHHPLVVVNSQMVQRHFEEHYGISSDSVRVVRSAIDPERFAASDRLKLRFEERRAWGIPDDATVGLLVAMNYRLKGLSQLLNAISLIPQNHPLQFAIVGNPNTAAYQRQAVRLGIADRVKFLGHRQSPKSAYFASDFLVHPTFYDPCSLVALEALACGLPVITTRYNGAAELLTPPNDGIVLDDPHNAPELARALSSMVDHGYRASASSAARQSATKWTFEHHYQSLLELFREVCRVKRAA